MARKRRKTPKVTAKTTTSCREDAKRHRPRFVLDDVLSL